MSKLFKWKSEDFDGYVEVAPIGDVKEHLAGDECWCSPVTEQNGGRPMIVHNVWDNCKSYNKQYGEVEEVVLPRPSFLPDGERVNGVPVDACIADVVTHLWQNDIVTLGSCCGHGKEAPSLILAQGERNYEDIERLINELDSRHWSLKQWQLVEEWQLVEVSLEPTVAPNLTTKESDL